MPRFALKDTAGMGGGGRGGRPGGGAGPALGPGVALPLVCAGRQGEGE